MKDRKPRKRSHTRKKKKVLRQREGFAIANRGGKGSMGGPGSISLVQENWRKKEKKKGYTTKRLPRLETLRTTSDGREKKEGGTVGGAEGLLASLLSVRERSPREGGGTWPFGGLLTRTGRGGSRTTGDKGKTAGEKENGSGVAETGRCRCERREIYTNRKQRGLGRMENWKQVAIA